MSRSPVPESGVSCLVTGASGFIGTELCTHLRAQGHAVTPLTRGDGRQAATWNPASGGLPASLLTGSSVLIHLAAAGIADRRWTRRRRQELVASRVDAVRALAGQVATVPTPPCIIAASAIGWYGDRGDEVLDENSSGGTGFLADLCRDWEAAWQPLRERGVRVLCLRIGLVLGPGGGALAAMLPLFRWGLGGALGPGRQWWSWITRTDLCAVIAQAVTDPRYTGSCNAVAPEPIRQAAFAAALGQALHRPACCPAPAWALRLALGGFADAALLSSQRVYPGCLREWGFSWRHPLLDLALCHALGSR